MTGYRTTVLLAIGALVSAMLCIYGALRLYSTRDAARAAQDELIECSQLARTLALVKPGLSNREVLGTLLPEASAALGEASARSGIAANAVQVGQPFPGAKAEVGLPIRLQGCTLEQLVTFVYRLSSEPAALQVQSLVLTGSPREQARWDMDLTLSCNIADEAKTEGR